jgi:hypothetical protein
LRIAASFDLASTSDICAGLVLSASVDDFVDVPTANKRQRRAVVELAHLYGLQGEVQARLGRRPPARPLDRPQLPPRLLRQPRPPRPQGRTRLAASLFSAGAAVLAGELSEGCPRPVKGTVRLQRSPFKRAHLPTAEGEVELAKLLARTNSRGFAGEPPLPPKAAKLPKRTKAKPAEAAEERRLPLPQLPQLRVAQQTAASLSAATPVVACKWFISR